MKRYKLKRDLPTFKAGQLCWLGIDGQLLTQNEENKVIMMYSASTMAQFPNILIDWFEEIPEKLKTVWDLEEGDECWMLDAHLEPLKIEWRGTPYDIRLRKLGKIYLTKEELEKQTAREEAKQILLCDTKGFKPDWSKTGAFNEEWVYTVYYNHRTLILCSNGYAVNQFSCDIWFENEEDAEASIKAHEEEWKIYLGVEE